MKKILAFLLVLMPVFSLASSMAVSSEVDYVLVMTAERKMFLMRSGVPVKEDPISLGLSPVGHKVFEGASRTPEGGCVLDWRNADSSFCQSVHISCRNQ